MKTIILEPDQEVVIQVNGLELRMTYDEIVQTKCMEVIDANRPKPPVGKPTPDLRK